MPHLLFLYIILFCCLQAVYGVLTSMEGCQAFEDALAHTKIGPWFYRVKAACEEYMGNTMAHKR